MQALPWRLSKTGASVIIVDGLCGLLLHLALVTFLQLPFLGQVVSGYAATNRADNAMMAGIVTGNTAGDGT